MEEAENGAASALFSLGGMDDETADEKAEREEEREEAELEEEEEAISRAVVWEGRSIHS